MSGLEHYFIPIGGTVATARVLPDLSGPQPIVVSDFKDLLSVRGGFMSASCNIPAAERTANPTAYALGATWLVKDTALNKFIYGGVLDKPLTQAGVTTLTSEGWGLKADREVERWRWQARPGKWVNGAAFPFKYQHGNYDHATRILAGPVMRQKDETHLARAGHEIEFRIPHDTIWEHNDDNFEHQGVVVQYTPGNNHKRIAFKIDRNDRPDSDFRLDVCTVNGPDISPEYNTAGWTVHQTINMGDSGPSEVDITIPNNHNLIALVLRHVGTNKKERKSRRFRIHSIRLWGHRGDQEDTLTINEAFQDIFGQLGASATNIQTHGFNILPYDSEQLTIAQICDELCVYGGRWFWRMTATPAGAKKGEAGSFGHFKTWDVIETRQPVQFLPDEQFNKISFQYVMGTEVYETKTITATNNPFPAGYNKVYQLDVEEPAGEQAMTAFAQEIIDYLSEDRTTGSATLAIVRDSDTLAIKRAHAIEPGDKLRFFKPDGTTIRETVVAGEISQGDVLCEIQFTSGNPLVDKWLALRKRRLALGFRPDAATLGALSNDKPEKPTGVTLAFEEIHKSNGKRHFDAIIDWARVTVDVNGQKTAIRRYEGVLQAVENDGTTPLAGVKDIHFSVKDDRDDPDDLAPTKKRLEIPQGKHNVKWRAKVHAEDVLMKMSASSGFTPAIKPSAFGPKDVSWVTVDVDQHKVTARWEDTDIENDADNQPKLDREVSYYKIRHYKNTGTVGTPVWTLQDTYRRKSNHIEFKVKKPGKLAHKIEVKGVDAYGNVSTNWGSGTNTKGQPLTPVLAPGIAFSGGTDSDMWLAEVYFYYTANGLSSGTPLSDNYQDDDTDHFTVEFQYGPNGTTDWTTKAKRRQNVELEPDEAGELHIAAFRVRGNKDVRTRYRAVDTKGHKSAWSPWATADVGEDTLGGGSTPAPAPLQVTMNTTTGLSFFNKEGDRYTGWTAKVKFAENADGLDAPHHYAVQLRKCDAAGNWLTDDDGDYITRKLTVAAKDEDANTFNVVNFPRIPKKSYWRARARGVNSGGKGPWSAWTDAKRAIRVPRKPINVGKIETLKRVGVKWDYQRNADGVPIDEADYFEIEGTSNQWASPDSDLSDSFVRSFKKTFKADDTTKTYDFRVRAVDADGDRGDWQYLSGTEAGTAVWNTLAATLPNAAHNPQVGLRDSQYVHVVGGGGSTAYGSPHALHNVYDRVAGTWTSKAAHPINRAGGSGFAVSGKMYAVTGYDGTSAVYQNYEYSVTGNSWVTKNTPSGVASWTNPDILPVIGTVAYLHTFQGSAKYDTATDTWTNLATKPGDAYFGSLAYDGTLMRNIGGWTGGGASVEHRTYNVTANTWGTSTDYPTATVYNAIGVLDGATYGAGGTASGGGGGSQASYKFDPSTLAWTAIANLPANKGDHALVPLNGKLHAIGGSTTHFQLDVLALGTGAVATPTDVSGLPTGTPPAPTAVTIDVDQQRTMVEWTPPLESSDTDTDKAMDLRLMEFQVQVATDAGFTNIIRNDKLRATRKTFRIKKPGTQTYYARVRSVGWDKTKSAWAVSVAGTKGLPPAPATPVITFDSPTSEKNRYNKVRTLVGFNSVASADDDIERYIVQLQQSATTAFSATDPRRRVIVDEPDAYSASATYVSVVDADSPIAHWRMNEAAGATTVVDRKATPANGTVAAGSTLGGTGLISSSDADTSISFNGTGGHVDLGHVAKIDALGNSWSIEAWVRPSRATADSESIFSEKYPGSGNVKMTLGRGSTGFTIGVYNGSWIKATGTTAPAQDTLYHVVGTYDGANLRLYVNGALAATQPCTATIAGEGHGYIIGRRWDTNSPQWWPGSVDEVAIYNTPLSLARVQAHYETGSGLTTGGPTDDVLSAIFDGVKIGKYVRARARALDTRGHKSPWSAWTSPTAVAVAQTVLPPFGVTAVTEDKRVGVDWDYYKTAGGDFVDDVDYFQVEGSSNGWGAVTKKDIFVRSTKRMWKETDTTAAWDFRVRAVDAEGNKSAWVYLSGATAGTEAWQTRLTSPSTGHNDSGPAVINGKLHFVQGRASTVHECHDPATNTWTQKAAASTKRHNMGVGTVGSYFYMAGGTDEGTNNGGLNNSTKTDRYDPVNNSWSLMAVVPQGSYGPGGGGSVPVIGGLIYMLGGYGNKQAGYFFDPVANAYTSRANAPYTLEEHTTAGAGDAIYAWHSGDTFIRFNVAANTWSTGLTSGGGIYQGTGQMLNDLFYVWGGSYTEFHSYNPITNAWTQRASTTTDGSSTGQSLIHSGYFYAFKNSLERYQVINVGNTSLIAGSGLKPVGIPPTPTISSLDVDPRRLRVDYSVIDDPADTDSDTLTRRPSPLVEYFQIQIATDSGFVTIVERDKMHKGTKKVFTRKAGTATYYARVRSVNWDGTKSPWSATVSAALAAPGVPTGLQSVSTDKSVGIDWSPPIDPTDGGVDSKVSYYQVQASKDNWQGVAVASTLRTMQDLHVVATRRMFKDESTNVYDFRVRSVAPSGAVSAWAYLSGAVIAGTDSWTSLVAAPYNNMGWSAPIGQAMYIGNGADTTHWMYDRVLNTFTTKTATPSAAPNKPIAWSNGTNVWRSGGSGNGVDRRTDRFNVALNTWTTMGQPPNEQRNAGYNAPYYNGLAWMMPYVCLAYDPVGDTYTTKAAPANSTRDSSNFVRVGGYGYYPGGRSGGSNNTNQHDRYDFALNSWSSLTVSPWTNSHTVNTQTASQGDMYMAWGGAWVSNNYLKTHYQWDTTLSAWTQKTSFPGSGAEISPYLRLDDGKLYCISYLQTFRYNGTSVPGGTGSAAPGSAFKPTGVVPAPTNLTSISSIDTVGVEWEAPDKTGDTALISDLIEYFQVEASRDGWSSIWKVDRRVAGTTRRFHSTAYTTDHDFRVRSVGWDGTKSAWVYLSGVTAGTETWTTRANLAAAKEQHGGADDGATSYLVGGSEPSGTRVRTVRTHDHVTNTNSTKADHPDTSGSTSGIACVFYGGKMYAIGGVGTSTLNKTYELDPAANAWATKTDMPSYRARMVSDLINGVVYCVGHYVGFNDAYVNQGYDVVLDAWSSFASAPSLISDAGGAAINGKLHTIASADSPTNKNYAYTPVGNSWATKADFPASNLWANRVRPLNGMLWISGGGSSDQFRTYDPTTDSYTSKTSILAGSRSSHSAHVYNGNYSVMGGVLTGSSTTARHDRFNVLSLPAISLRPTQGGSGGSGVSDHGALTGLADDDHPQYLTNGRGDARYIKQPTVAPTDNQALTWDAATSSWVAETIAGGSGGSGGRAILKAGRFTGTDLTLDSRSWARFGVSGEIETTFVAPASGKAWVELSAQMQVGAGADTRSWLGVWNVVAGTLMQGSTFFNDDQGTETLTPTQITKAFLLEGLTPGQIYTIAPAGASNSGIVTLHRSEGLTVLVIDPEASGDSSGSGNASKTLLAELHYHPVAVTSVSGTTGATREVIDATNLKTSFVAPVSGEVIVMYSASSYNATNGMGVIWGLQNVVGGALVANSEVAAVGASAYASGTMRATKITGLTPGQTYSWVWTHRSSGATVATTRYGGEWGPASLTIWDAKPSVSAAASSGGLELISEQALTAAQATINVADIPQTYEALLVKVVGRGTDAAVNVACYCTFNNDSAANYHTQQLYGGGASSVASSLINQTKAYLGQLPAATGSAGRAGFIDAEVPQYKGSTWHKMVLSRATSMYSDTAAHNIVEHNGNTWKSAAAINQLTLSLNAGSFAVGTVVQVYGLRKVAAAVSSSGSSTDTTEIHVDLGSTVGAAIARIPILQRSKLVGAMLTVKNASGSGEVRVDINRQPADETQAATSLFTDQTKRPKILATERLGPLVPATDIPAPDLYPGDSLVIDVDDLGVAPYVAAVLADSPLAYYKLDEASGTTAADTSPNARHATYSGPLLAQAGPMSGNAAYFDGVDDVVTLPSGLALVAGSPVTIEYWIRVAAADSTREGSAFTIGNQSAPNRCQSHNTWSDGAVYWDYGTTDASGRVSVAFGSRFDQFIHVVLVSSGSANTFQAVYYNGVVASSKTSSAGPTSPLSGGFIGRETTKWQRMHMAHFAVYNTVLSPTRITAHYDAAAGGAGSGASGLRGGVLLQKV